MMIGEGDMMRYVNKIYSYIICVMEYLKIICLHEESIIGGSAGLLVHAVLFLPPNLLHLVLQFRDLSFHHFDLPVLPALSASIELAN